MNARVEPIVVNGRSILTTRNVSRAVAVLVSRQAGKEAWATRNDRFFTKTTKSGHPASIEDQVELAEKEAQGWTSAEPLSQFRVMVCDYSDLRSQRYLDEVR